MKAVALLIAVLAFQRISAQENTFTVLINKGQNQIKARDNWHPIKVGSTFKTGDIIKISQNGYLGLVHVSGKPLEVKSEGTHKVLDLASKIKEGSSVLHKYTDFILSSTQVKRNKLTATGAVKRGTDEINVFLPDSKHAIVFNDDIDIVWRKDAGTPTYVVRFNSMFGDELENVQVTDTVVSINLNRSQFAREDKILVEVSSKNNPQKKSEPVMIRRMSTGDKASIAALVSELGESIQDKSALSQLYLARFYEEHSLLIDASTAYVRAIKLASDVPYFHEAYQAFLDRNNFITQK